MLARPADQEPQPAKTPSVFLNSYYWAFVFGHTVTVSRITVLDKGSRFTVLLTKQIPSVYRGSDGNFLFGVLHSILCDMARIKDIGRP